MFAGPSSDTSKFTTAINAMAEALSGRQTETLRYEVPRQRELAAAFAKAALIGTDGKTVAVGRFTARKIGPISRFIFMATPESGCNWEIRSSHKGLENAVAFSKAARSDPAEIIGVLAHAEAGFHIGAEEKTAALRDALRKKLDTLAP